MITATCPICQKRLEARELKDLPCFPFCTERCRLIDLGRWLGEDYKLPAPLTEGDFDDADDPVP